MSEQIRRCQQCGAELVKKEHRGLAGASLVDTGNSYVTFESWDCPKGHPQDRSLAD